MFLIGTMLVILTLNTGTEVMNLWCEFHLRVGIVGHFRRSDFEGSV